MTAKRNGTRLLSDFALGIGGKLIGGRFPAILRDLQTAQWQTPELLQLRAEQRLASLLEHAARNVPFYRETYRKLNLDPRELRDGEGLRALPILGKTQYRERGPEQFAAENIPAYRRLERSTSGSTGEPFRFCIDRDVLPVIYASHLFYDSWFDWSPFDRYLRIVSPPAEAPPVQADSPIRFRYRQTLMKRLQRLYESRTQRKVSVWEVTGDRALDVWRQIQSFRPSFILGYTSTLGTIADELLSRGLTLPHPVRGVVTIAEMLSANTKKLIEDYFQCPIINRYGLREFGSWSAQSCSESSTRLHINTELAICEIVRPDGSPCPPGEVGRVVMTDLRNYARPFIRYDTGDLAVLGSGRCPCGRGFPILEHIEGRAQECLRTPSGKVISAAILGHYLFVYNGHLEAVRHYQLIHEAPARARLIVVPGSGWSEEKRLRILRDLEKLLGQDVKTNVDVVPRIAPEKSGKRPIIKSDLRLLPEDGRT